MSWQLFCSQFEEARRREMKVLTLQGRPRLEGNREELLKPRVAGLVAAGPQTEQIGLCG